MSIIRPIVEPLTNGFNLTKENVNGMFSNMTLLTTLLLSLTKDRPFPKTTLTFEDEYDYIIVGGGTAGSVMANRLSEGRCIKVLLLEAGGDAPILTEVPSYARIFLRSSIDWYYKTTPQKHSAHGQKENRVIWNSGKVLGGSSVLNAMLYVRGNRRNYDDWEREGATGWGYEGVLPYFKKLEDNKNINELDAGFHATGGPMTAEKPNYNPEFKDPAIKASLALGFELTDPNGKRQTGIYDLQGTLRNGQRCSTAKAYLVPADSRKNLDIVKKAFVTKVLIEDKRAVGVQVDFLGSLRTVRARKEVIISAGSVRTAQLLMLSGIGLKEHLEAFGIEVISNLPVGQNLQDHYGTHMVYLVNSTIPSVIVKNSNPINILKYIANRSGPLAAPTQISLITFHDGLDPAKNAPDFPRQELYFGEYAAIDQKVNSNIKPEVYEQVYKGHDFSPSYTCAASILQPLSRGEILLSSTNPYDHPLINPNYYENDTDVKNIVQGMKICQEISRRPEMQEVQARPLGTVFPGCERFVGNDDEYLACQAKSVIQTIWHPSGTARMGQRNDPRSVVDPKLRVIGVDGLRVVNAAVMPIIPSGNTNVPTMMIAEKAADIIKSSKSYTCSK